MSRVALGSIRCVVQVPFDGRHPLLDDGGTPLDSLGDKPLRGTGTRNPDRDHEHCK